jgi:hypothetical protein
MSQPEPQPVDGPAGPPTANGTPDARQALLATITTPGNGIPAERPTPGRDGIPAYAITHGACDSWWTGLSRSHCASCCRTFSGETAANRHRIGKHGVDRRCADPAEVGLVAAEKPYGVMWSNPAPEGGYHFHSVDDEAVTA